MQYFDNWEERRNNGKEDIAFLTPTPSILGVRMVGVIAGFRFRYIFSTKIASNMQKITYCVVIYKKNHFPSYFKWMSITGYSQPGHHDDIIKWKHFPRYWPFMQGIHRSPVNSPHKGQWRGALMFSLICNWINNWVNNRQAGDLRCYRANYDVIVM